MTTTVPSKLSIIPALLALAVVILIGYLLFTNLESSRTELMVEPPIETIEPKRTELMVEPPIETIEPKPEALSSEQRNEQDANAFITALSKSQQSAIIVKENHDQFVRGDSVIVLPDLEQRTTSIEQLLAAPHLPADTSLTIHKTTEVTKETSLAQLSDEYDDHTRLITIIDSQGQKQTKPLFELLNQDNIDLTAPITVLTEQQHTLQVKAGELATIEGVDKKQSVNITIHHGVQKLSLKEIIKTGEIPDNALFYLHRVTEQDQQGLWGIIQAGLIDKFREGVHIEGISPNKNSVQTIIPADADERLASGFSSFLGKVLNNKVNSSYVYNFSTHTMSNDPNLIHPGQQLILIHFQTEELSAIYHFFSDKRNQGIETFAIDD